MTNHHTQREASLSKLALHFFFFLAQLELDWKKKTEGERADSTHVYPFMHIHIQQQQHLGDCDGYTEAKQGWVWLGLRWESKSRKLEREVATS